MFKHNVVETKILANAWIRDEGLGPEAKARAFMQMTRAEIKICSPSDSQTG